MAACDRGVCRRVSGDLYAGSGVDMGMVIYLAVFAAVTGMSQAGAVSLMRLAGAAMKRKKDVAVVQREE